MLRYVNTGVVFSEIPDEVTLSINISGCPCHCPGCHSQYLWNNIGEPLTPVALSQLIRRYGNSITCVSLMGGDAEPAYVSELAGYVQREHPTMKVAWYSGRTRISSDIDRNQFDYIKVGPYIRHLGALDSPRTNQRLYRKEGDGQWRDITARFWRRQPEQQPAAAVAR